MSIYLAFSAGFSSAVSVNKIKQYTVSILDQYERGNVKQIYCCFSNK